MIAKIDKVISGISTAPRGIEIQIAGRIKGAERASKKGMKRGKISQQDRLSHLEENIRVIYTKYGTLGIRVKRTSMPRI